MKNIIEETTRLLLQGTLIKDEADKILLDLHNVSNRRELLIAFIQWYKDYYPENNSIEGAVDYWLENKSN
jgi:hypothetical protein